MLKMSSIIESILTDARRKRSVKLAAENARKRGAAGSSFSCGGRVKLLDEWSIAGEVRCGGIGGRRQQQQRR